MVACAYRRKIIKLIIIAVLFWSNAGEMWNGKRLRPATMFINCEEAASSKKSYNADTVIASRDHLGYRLLNHCMRHCSYLNGVCFGLNGSSPPRPWYAQTRQMYIASICRTYPIIAFIKSSFNTSNAFWFIDKTCFVRRWCET